MSKDTEASHLEFIEPCLVSLRLRGKVDHEELGELIDGFEPLVAERTFFALEVDMREVAGATPEARRIGAERLVRLPRFAIAIITTGFAQRMIAKLVVTAIQMLKPGQLTGKYFNDTESSRAWLLERIADHERGA